MRDLRHIDDSRLETTAVSDDMAAFLAARLDEDETAAKALESGDWGQSPWAVTECSGFCPCIVYQGEYKPVLEAQVPLIQYIADAEAPEYAAHIARHDPARVLREVAAKRAILAVHSPGYPVTYPKPSGQPTCAVCHSGGWDWDPEQWPCPTVRALAAIYSNHPGYRQEWAP
jgi:hypothetical protein